MDNAGVKYPDLIVQLIGRDGNIFVLAGVVSAAIRKSYGDAAAKDFLTKVMEQESYEEALSLILRTVNVE